MGKLILIRHGKPDTPPGCRCWSATDFPLSEEGRRQAKELAGTLTLGADSRLFSSPLKRCRETADILACGRDVQVVDAFSEMRAGAWEGLTFDEIAARWPEVYAQRGHHMGSTAPVGGESFLEAGRRFDRTLAPLWAGAQGDVVIVSHGGVIRGWLCEALGLDPDHILEIRQPWGGVTVLRQENGAWRLDRLGERPLPYPSGEEIAALYARCGTPAEVQAHCGAVARMAGRLVAGSRAPIRGPLLHAACLVHDLCRSEGRTHAASAARLLDKEGWPVLADLVSRHHDLGEAPSPEAELLFLADKLVSGTQPVSIAARFEGSKGKCATPEALSAWQRRYDTVLRLAQAYGIDPETVPTW